MLWVLQQGVARFIQCRTRSTYYFWIDYGRKNPPYDKHAEDHQAKKQSISALKTKIKKALTTIESAQC
jgi:SAM-dependent MidA family methyltransferase